MADRESSGLARDRSWALRPAWRAQRPQEIRIVVVATAWDIAGMDRELTRGTAWLALLLYVAAELSTRPGAASGTRGRWLNSCGCAVFLAHVVCAFYFYHHWSHAAAYADTARQTREMVGWNWGGGLWINYFFGLIWLLTIVWWWANPGGYAGRPAWIRWAVRGFFWLMIINGAVIFAHGPVKWFGAVLCVVLIWSWWPRRAHDP